MRSLSLGIAMVLLSFLTPPPAAADPPSAVTDLAVITGRYTAAVAFTVPAGADHFEVRYWDGSMSEPGWWGYYFGASGACTANTQFCVSIADLDDCHTYYWAVRVSGTGGWSALSNQPTETTKCSPSQQVVGCQ